MGEKAFESLGLILTYLPEESKLLIKGAKGFFDFEGRINTVKTNNIKKAEKTVYCGYLIKKGKLSCGKHDILFEGLI